jgi:hypothetical protein
MKYLFYCLITHHPPAEDLLLRQTRMQSDYITW